MTETLVYAGTVQLTTCWCGIHHGIPRDLMRMAEDTGITVYCPLGHRWVVKETRATRLARELREQEERTAQANRRAQATRDLLLHEERSHAATRGHLTRQKRRAAAGVCPCCTRTFQQLERHMKTQHPDFVKNAAAQ